MKKLFCVIALFGLAVFAQANEYYIVKAEIYDNKSLIGTPTIVVRPNEEASILVEGSYSLDLMVVPNGKEPINLNTTIKYWTENYDREIAPSFVINLGKEAQTTVDGTAIKVVVNEYNP